MRAVERGWLQGLDPEWGLNYWREKGALLEGDAFAQRALNRIPAGGFFVEKDYENWIVIDVSVLEKSEARVLIPQSISLSYENDEEKFVETFKATVAKFQHNRFLSVLICSEKGEHYERIEKFVQKTDVTNVFFLEGGLVALRAGTRRQNVSKVRAQLAKKLVEECGFLLVEAGRHLGVSPSAVAKILSRQDEYKYR